MLQEPQIDFAISYAGEDRQIGKELARSLRELGFEVFFAENVRHILVGADGEVFFERLFSEAKEVIVLISQHYRKKKWTRFEWDIIQERANRFVAIKLDESRITGLPSNIFYVRFTGNNYPEIIEACVSRLLLYEREIGFSRPTEYERILYAIKNESKGELAKAFQLVVDQRKRTPLDDLERPQSSFEPSYRVVEEEWHNYSVARRRSVKIVVPRNLSREELRFNLKHCTATQFNAFKPDAIMVFAYNDTGSESSVSGPFNAGRAIFAPFGDWSKALDGVAYNIPTNEFEYSIDFAPHYFS